MGNKEYPEEEGGPWEFFEEAPISLWKVDLSEVKACLDSLRDQGVTDLRAHLTRNPREVVRCAARIRVLDVNGYTLELYKAGSKEELFGGMMSIIPPAAQPLLLEELLAIDGGAKVFQGEMENRDLHGERLHVFLKWAASPARQGDYSRVMLALIDLTTRVAAEERLKESEKLYRMLADNAQDLICVCDADLVRTYVSPSYEKVLGFRPEELLGQNLFSLMGPEERELRKEEFIEDWRPDIVRRRVMRKDGRHIWVDANSVPVHDENGSIIAWIVVSRDVDEKAKAEEKLKESERLYRMLADNTQDLISVNDNRFVRTYVSPSYKTVLGYDTDELLGRPVVSLLHPEDLEEARRIMGRSAAEGTPGLMRLRNRHKDGHYVWLESQGTPLFDDEGNRVGGMTVSRVVTGQVEAEEALRDSNEQLKDFLSVAAHELRHPINLVQGYVGTLRDLQDVRDPELLDDIHSGITKSSGRLVRLVEELLEVSRIDQGRFAFEFSRGRPRELVEEAAEELRLRGAANNFEVKSEEGLEDWTLDPDKFRQLMVILLENASNYSPDGTTVEIELRTSGKKLDIAVADRGRGVDEEERERIFQRFFQSDDPLYHSVPGLGMGLYIAREIVEGHGGEIHHEHRPGGGSVFRFTIPGRD